MKVLVVDDQPDVVAGILDGVNWRALHVEKAYSALSAAEAKDLLLREKIDILLCDIEMPGESGLSLVAWLQNQGRETKCIFLTAHADFPYAQKALQLGAVDYLLQLASYENIEAAIWRAAEQLQEEGLPGEKRRAGDIEFSTKRVAGIPSGDPAWSQKGGGKGRCFWVSGILPCLPLHAHRRTGARQKPNR